MFFSLDVIRARKGDCLMLHYGSANDPHLIMIDGGPKSVYAPHLKPRIQRVRKVRGLQADKPLRVDIIMVSHIDDDHIKGILDLTKEMIPKHMAKQPQLLRVRGIWHNSFDNIIESKPDELTAAFKNQFGAASTGGELPDDATIEADDEDLDDETIRASLQVLASIEQGSRLRGDAKTLGFESNPEVEGKLIMATENSKALEIGAGLSFTVVGPMEPELEKLRTKHQEWLIDLKKKGKTPPEALAAYVDPSVPNLSSIVVLAEAGGKKILLTGDARGDKILEGLELVGLIKKGETIDVDVLKVPHHGSSNNLDNDFFKRIRADHYVFSGNGEHGNPERESLEMLLAARGNADAYTIHVTYPIAEIDQARQAEWEKQQARQKAKQQAHPEKVVEVREDWSPAEHSLAALFAANPDFENKLSIIQADEEPHVINLLDKLGI